ncbi:MAG: hypothetical protein LBS26_02625 [Campylobacteraceae bacterium]|jgi:hypothetical protein|nr:hypothetical protein [Campylobacteraceae bacterium]
MKKIFAYSIALVLALVFNGCEDKKSNNSSTINGGTPSVKHPYAYGYGCEAGDVVNGYELPACPDPVENDKTLLGIDSNNNGVRDDVERWLIVRYKNDHKIVTEIGFQTARAVQIVIQDPSKAQETYPIEDAAQFCNSYFTRYANLFNEPILIDHIIITSTAFKTIQLNTRERIKAYLAYDKALSGGVYRLPHADERRAFCSFDVNALLGE